jgi:hypothetical protein
MRPYDRTASSFTPLARHAASSASRWGSVIWGVTVGWEGEGAACAQHAAALRCIEAAQPLLLMPLQA